jgi:hypothetical protein
MDVYPAPECPVALEVRAEQPLPPDSRLPYDALLIVGLRR